MFNPLKWGDLLQKAQEQMKNLEGKLVQLRVESTAGAGLVRAVLNGKIQLLELHIDPSLFEKREPKLVEDLVLSAVNQGIQKVQQTLASEIGPGFVPPSV